MSPLKHWSIGAVLVFSAHEVIAQEQACLQAPAAVTGLIEEPRRHVVGAAYVDDQLDYCEWHSTVDNGQQTVVYWLGEQVIALKYLRFGKNTSMPEVAQRDFRTGELRQVAIADDKLMMGYRAGAHRERWLPFSPKLNMQALSVTERVAVEQEQVIDAGFDHYVRGQWSSLAAGDTREFYFASPVHDKNLRLRARAEPKACAADAALCVVVEPASGLLRLFAGELVLAYDSDRRLQMFKGVTNIADNNGESKERRIDYYYW